MADVTVVTRPSDWCLRAPSALGLSLLCAAVSLVAYPDGGLLYTFPLWFCCGARIRRTIEPGAYGPSPAFDLAIVALMYTLSYTPQLLISMIRCACFVVMGVVAVDLS